MNPTYTRKYHRGRLLRNERKQIWVFGGIQKDNNNSFITTVQKRDKDTLLPLIKKLMLPGTKIITDGWKTYNNLEQEGYIHDIVNHSIGFIIFTFKHNVCFVALNHFIIKTVCHSFRLTKI